MERAETDVTQTPAFKRWFAGSKVVDADGKPLRVYHGTNRSFAAFSNDRLGTNTRTLVQGHFFTGEPGLASSFARGEGASVVPVYLALKNPKIIDAGGRTVNAVLGAYEEGIARDDGHDGFIVQNVVDAPGFVLSSAGGRSTAKPSTLFIAFSPNQIKSAIGNKGNFDPSNPDITESQVRRIIDVLLA